MVEIPLDSALRCVLLGNAAFAQKCSRGCVDDKPRYHLQVIAGLIF
jgi:hypothetical protein